MHTKLVQQILIDEMLGAASNAMLDNSFDFLNINGTNDCSSQIKDFTFNCAFLYNSYVPQLSVISANIFGIAYGQLFIRVCEKYSFPSIIHYFLKVISNMGNKQLCKGISFCEFFDLQLGTLSFLDVFSRFFYLFDIYSLQEVEDFKYLEHLQQLSLLADFFFNSNVNGIFATLNNGEAADIFSYAVMEEKLLTIRRQLAFESHMNFLLFHKATQAILRLYKDILRFYSSIQVSLFFRVFLEDFLFELVFKLTDAKIGQVSFNQWFKNLTTFLVINFIRYRVLCGDNRISFIHYMSIFYAYMLTYEVRTNSTFFSRSTFIQYTVTLPLLLSSLYRCVLDIVYGVVNEFSVYVCLAVPFLKINSLVNFGDIVVAMPFRREIVYTVLQTLFVSFSRLKEYILLKLLGTGNAYVLERSLVRELYYKLMLHLRGLDLLSISGIDLRKKKVLLKFDIIIELETPSFYTDDILSQLKENLHLLVKVAYAHACSYLISIFGYNVVSLCLYNVLKLEVKLFGGILTITEKVQEGRVCYEY